MVASDKSLYVGRGSGDLIDRVVQLRRVLAGMNTDYARLRQELLRLRRANQTLERELKAVAHPRR